MNDTNIGTYALLRRLARFLRGYPLRSMYGPVDPEPMQGRDDGYRGSWTHEPEGATTMPTTIHPRIRAIVEDAGGRPPWSSAWVPNEWRGYDYHRGGDTPLIRLAADTAISEDDRPPVVLYGMTGDGALLWEIDLDGDSVPLYIQRATVRSALSWADHTTLTDVPR